MSKGYEYINNISESGISSVQNAENFRRSLEEAENKGGLGDNIIYAKTKNRVTGGWDKSTLQRTYLKTTTKKDWQGKLSNPLKKRTAQAKLGVNLVLSHVRDMRDEFAMKSGTKMLTQKTPSPETVKNWQIAVQLTRLMEEHADTQQMTLTEARTLLHQAIDTASPKANGQKALDHIGSNSTNVSQPVKHSNTLIEEELTQTVNHSSAPKDDQLAQIVEHSNAPKDDQLVQIGHNALNESKEIHPPMHQQNTVDSLSSDLEPKLLYVNENFAKELEDVGNTLNTLAAIDNDVDQLNNITLIDDEDDDKDLDSPPSQIPVQKEIEEEEIVHTDKLQPADIESNEPDVTIQSNSPPLGQAMRKELEQHLSDQQQQLKEIAAAKTLDGFQNLTDGLIKTTLKNVDPKDQESACYKFYHAEFDRQGGNQKGTPLKEMISNHFAEQLQGKNEQSYAREIDGDDNKFNDFVDAVWDQYSSKNLDDEQMIADEVERFLKQKKQKRPKGIDFQTHQQQNWDQYWQKEVSPRLYDIIDQEVATAFGNTLKDLNESQLMELHDRFAALKQVAKSSGKQREEARLDEFLREIRTAIGRRGFRFHQDVKSTLRSISNTKQAANSALTLHQLDHWLGSGKLLNLFSPKTVLGEFESFDPKTNSVRFATGAKVALQAEDGKIELHIDYSQMYKSKKGGKALRWGVGKTIGKIADKAKTEQSDLLTIPKARARKQIEFSQKAIALKKLLASSQEDNATVTAFLNNHATTFERSENNELSYAEAKVLDRRLQALAGDKSLPKDIADNIKSMQKELSRLRKTWKDLRDQEDAGRWTLHHDKKKQQATLNVDLANMHGSLIEGAKMTGIAVNDNYLTIATKPLQQAAI